VRQLAKKAIDIYQKLESLVAPRFRTPTGVTKVNKPCKLLNCINSFLDSEIGFSSKVATIAGDTTLQKTTNATYDADAEGEPPRPTRRDQHKSQ